jgi:hypothetical protein
VTWRDNLIQPLQYTGLTATTAWYGYIGPNTQAGSWEFRLYAGYLDGEPTTGGLAVYENQDFGVPNPPYPTGLIQVPGANALELTSVTLPTVGVRDTTGHTYTVNLSTQTVTAGPATATAMVIPAALDATGTTVTEPGTTMTVTSEQVTEGTTLHAQLTGCASGSSPAAGFTPSVAAGIAHSNAQLYNSYAISLSPTVLSNGTVDVTWQVPANTPVGAGTLNMTCSASSPTSYLQADILIEPTAP